MRKKLVVVIGIASGLAGLYLGYFVGLSMQEPPPRPRLSIYIADVTLDDAETGMPVNASLRTPGGFLPVFQLSESGSRTIPGQSYGPYRSEQDPKTGRCRITWIGAPGGGKFDFHFDAEGYEPLKLPARCIREINSVSFASGIGGPTKLSMTRVEQGAGEPAATGGESNREP